MIVAIDGPAASGKGTLGRSLAAMFGLPYLDTGTLYRAVALELIDAGQDTHDAHAAERVARTFDPSSMPPDAELRRADLGEGASVVSAHPGVRSALLDLQRAFAATPGGAVLDGRDIGTVICPDADLKVYVTARPEVRAARRHADLTARGETVGYGSVLSDIVRRDARDSGRPDAPLTVAADAFLVDSSDLDAREVLGKVLARWEGTTTPAVA